MVGTVLDTVIGLSFVFALTALMVTACVEGVEARVKKRAKWLLRGIKQLFEAPDGAPSKTERVKAVTVGARAVVKAENSLYSAAQTAGTRTAATGAPANAPVADLADADKWIEALFSHPLLQSLAHRDPLTRKVTKLPKEISPELFAKALLDRLLGDSPRTIEGVLNALKDKKAPDQLQEALRALLKTIPDEDEAKIQKAIEDWFNAQMKSVAEAYRRWTKRWAIAIGIVAAGIMNVSTISIAHALYVDQPLRDATVAAATSGALCEGTGDDDVAKADSTRTCVSEEIKKLDDKGMPIGWPAEGPAGVWWGVLMVLGWLLTGLAASFGAPFWFDALKRLSGAKKSLEGT